MASPAIRAVTFDVGGTLIEPWPSVGHVYAAVAAEHGVRGISPELLTRRFREAWQSLPDFRHTRAQWSALVDATFSGLTPVVPSRTFFSDLYERFAAPAAWRIFEDVLPCLEELAAAGLKLGVISNWDDRLLPLLGRLDLARYFSTLVVSCEIGCVKPTPAIFQTAAERLRLPPGAILHVGDSLEADVRGAQAAGLRALLLARGAKTAGPGRITSLRQARGHLPIPACS